METIYRATDGTEFENKSECLKYEQVVAKDIQQEQNKLKAMEEAVNTLITLDDSYSINKIIDQVKDFLKEHSLIANEKLFESNKKLFDIYRALTRANTLLLLKKEKDFDRALCHDNAQEIQLMAEQKNMVEIILDNAGFYEKALSLCHVQKNHEARLEVILSYAIYLFTLQDYRKGVSVLSKIFGLHVENLPLLIGCTKVQDLYYQTYSQGDDVLENTTLSSLIDTLKQGYIEEYSH